MLWLRGSGASARRSYTEERSSQVVTKYKDCSYGRARHDTYRGRNLHLTSRDCPSLDFDGEVHSLAVLGSQGPRVGYFKAAR
eukprot:6191257-Pleurochrysis_carterae.AAC.1